MDEGQRQRNTLRFMTRGPPELKVRALLILVHAFLIVVGVRGLVVA